MNDLAQALAERVPGFFYDLAPMDISALSGPMHGWYARGVRADGYSCSAWKSTPAGAVRMLNEALREAGK